MITRPSDELFRKLVPLLARIVGFAFIIFGVLFLLAGVACLFSQAANSKMIGAVFIGGSLLHIAVGIVVVKYVAGWMLSIRERLRQKGW
jgi:predicted lysophospholipase L1 biosynthesis ABC-type transport system permease subunit